MKVWLLPIEPLEERYSAQWYRWFPRELERLGCSVQVVDGERLTEKIETGQFLDVLDTNYYKARQLSHFTVMLKMGQVRDGDWVLLLDAWNPALTALAYLRDFGNVKFKIAGLFHAGAYDPWDMLGQNQDFAAAAGSWESGWLYTLDRVFVATEFHRALLGNARGCIDKIEVTGFPLYAAEWQGWSKPWEVRSPRVVFPHRLAPEKDPEAFYAIHAAYHALYGNDGTEWVRSKDVVGSKTDYYHLLGDSKVAISTAKQETWGIAMLEATSLGCYPVVPPRLSYPEMYPAWCQAHTVEEYARRIHTALSAEAPYPYEGHHERTAIERMVESMKRSS